MDNAPQLTDLKHLKKDQVRPESSRTAVYTSLVIQIHCYTRNSYSQVLFFLCLRAYHNQNKMLQIRTKLEALHRLCKDNTTKPLPLSLVFHLGQQVHIVQVQFARHHCKHHCFFATKAQKGNRKHSLNLIIFKASVVSQLHYPSCTNKGTKNILFTQEILGSKQKK